jgi:hypothetical protein
LLAQDLLARRRTGPADATAAPPRAYGLVATAFAVVAGYIALMPLIGFRLSTVLFVAAFQLVLDRPASALSWAKLVAIAVGTSAVTYAVFEHYLLVLLPRGAWTGW